MSGIPITEMRSDRFYSIDYSLLLDKNRKIANEKSGEGIIYIPRFASEKLEIEGRQEKLSVYKFNVHINKPRCNSATISLACLILPYFIIKSVCDAYFPVVPGWGVYLIACFSYAPLCMAYHVFRIAMIPLKLIGHTIKEIYEGKGVKKTLQKAAKVWVRETGRSLFSIIKAPFYALIFNIGHIITLFSPRKGMMFVSLIEQKWNHDIPINQGYSLLSLFGQLEHQRQIEGGWDDMDNFKPTAWYLLRCFQPIARGFVYEAPNKEIALEMMKQWQKEIQATVTQLETRLTTASREEIPLLTKELDLWKTQIENYQKRIEELENYTSNRPIIFANTILSLGGNRSGKLTNINPDKILTI